MFILVTVLITEYLLKKLRKKNNNFVFDFFKEQFIIFKAIY